MFLSVGRLVETKGYDTLIEAYRLLKERGDPNTFDVLTQSEQWAWLAARDALLRRVEEET